MVDWSCEIRYLTGLFGGRACAVMFNKFFVWKVPRLLSQL